MKRLPARKKRLKRLSRERPLPEKRLLLYLSRQSGKSVQLAAYGFLCSFQKCFRFGNLLLQSTALAFQFLYQFVGLCKKRKSQTETTYKNTKQTVRSQLNGLAALTGQIEERKRYILTINNDVESIDRELSSLERQLGKLQRDLKDKKRNTSRLSSTFIRTVPLRRS